jgi:phage terminase large subunit GpA-like protein
MDAFTDPAVDQVVMMLASQVGKTEALNNLIGFHVDLEPCPILVIQPTLEMAQTWSKDRLVPMLRDTPSLKGRVKDPWTRDANNTTLHKVFAGGHLTVVGANSAAGLASRPIRVVLCDEVDRYEPSATGEGDPIELAVKRASTFWNRKVGLASSPKIKGESRIEAAYLASDQRRFFVPCPFCGARQTLRWKQVVWPKGRPELACYECEACSKPWSDHERVAAVALGGGRRGALRQDGGFHAARSASPGSGSRARRSFSASRLDGYKSSANHGP